MKFGQILKNVLDKNHQVWIPTIGLLSYDKATSKLNLDTYGSGTDTDIISLISDIKQVSQGEAKGIMIQEVEALKSAVKNQGKFSIEGAGEITFVDGSYQFEVKKSLFPTDFFGGGNFNPTTFVNNPAPPPAPKKEEVKPTEFQSTFIKIETPAVNKSEDLFSSQLDGLLEAKKEEKAPIKEVVIEPVVEKAVIEEPVVEKIETPIEKVEEIIVPEPEPVMEVVKEEEPVFHEVEETHTNNIEPIHEEIEEEKFETMFLEDEKETIEYEEPIGTQEEPIKHVEKKIEEIIIDEPRRNIGKARYDEGFYEYSGYFSEEGSNKLKFAGMLGAAVLVFGILGYWLASTFMNKKVEPKKPAVVAQKVDTTVKKIDSNTNLTLSKKDSMSVAAPVASTPIAATKTTASTPVEASPKTATSPNTLASKTSTNNTQNTTKNTQPKTPSSDPVSKKSVAVATKSTTKTIESKVNKKEVASSADSKSENSASNKVATDAKKETAKAEKINVIGKPYATSNYTKGNYYLSFGKFKIPSAAKKLRQDIKSKAGVETDIIMVDGTYRVVIPYVNKDKAMSASQDFPSTTLFE